MQLQISFQELTQYFKQHFGLNLTFSFLKENEFKMVYRHKVVVVDVPVSLDVRVLEVAEHSVVLGLAGKMGMDIILRGFMAYCKNKYPQFYQAITLIEGAVLKVDLTRLRGTRKLMDQIALHGITVAEDGFSILSALR